MNTNHERRHSSRRSRFVEVAVTTGIAFIAPPALGLPGGIAGYSGAQGVDCTSCHTPVPEGPLATVEVIDVATGLSDPSMVEVGSTRSFMVRISGGPAVVCGFDVSTQGIGELVPSASDSGVRAQQGELTHTMPRSFSKDATCEFAFDWQAPISPTQDPVILYAAGNSANGNQSNSGDAIATTTHAIEVVPEPSSQHLAVAAIAALGIARRPWERRRQPSSP